MTQIVLLGFALLLADSGQVPRDPGARPATFAIQFPSDAPLLRGRPIRLVIVALDAAGSPLESFSGTVTLRGVISADGEAIVTAGPFTGGRVVLPDVLVPSGRVQVQHAGGAVSAEAERKTVLAPLTLLPPLAAIILALLTRQVIISLFCGVWIGAVILEGGNVFIAFLRSLDTYVVQAVADTDHAHIIVFSLSLAGMVGVIHALGGIHGIVGVVSRLSRGPRSGQVATWLLGTVIFFDDYANSLIVGNTMRHFTDRVRISREKLSFIVDATAAPVATVGVISTWTAYQLGLIGDVLPGVSAEVREPYLFFLESIPYSFYSLLMLLLVFVVSVSLRDFGPMREAEERTRRSGEVLRPGAEPLIDDAFMQVEPDPGIPPRWFNAALPIGCLIIFTLGGLIYTGSLAVSEAGIEQPRVRDIIGRADAYRALLWAAVLASVVAGGLALLQRQKVSQIVSNWVNGARSLFLAAVILVLAWSISHVCGDLGTGDAVAWMVPDLLVPQVLPAVTFVTSGVIAFSTGTSYGTMGILIPILLPLCYRLGEAAALDPAHADTLGFATLAAVLGGAVFGDHCSPISDTTVLSSMASGADHIDHVRTQLPYAILVAAVCVPSYLLVGFGVPLPAVLLAAVALLVGLHLILSRRPPVGGPAAGSASDSPPRDAAGNV